MDIDWENDRGWRLAVVRAVTIAIRDGVLVPATACECGRVGPTEAHHWHGYDPEHAFDVQWLCKSCHAKIHGGPAGSAAWRAVATPEQLSAIGRMGAAALHAKHGTEYFRELGHQTLEKLGIEHLREMGRRGAASHGRAGLQRIGRKGNCIRHHGRECGCWRYGEHLEYSI